MVDPFKDSCLHSFSLESGFDRNDIKLWTQIKGNKSHQLKETHLHIDIYYAVLILFR